MANKVTVHWNPNGWSQLGASVGRGTARAAAKVRDDAKRIITDEGRVDTGALRNSIVSQKVATTAGSAIYTVGSDMEYAMAQHEGVKGPVVPVHARVLRFTPKGASAVVFRPRTRGFEGIHYLTRALDGLKPEDFRW